MKPKELLLEIQRELQRHSMDTFVQNPPSVAKGGNDVVAPGCPACRKVINTAPEFVNHLCQDALPKLFAKLLPVRQTHEYRNHFSM